MADSSNTKLEWLASARKATSENRLGEALKMLTKVLDEENGCHGKAKGSVAPTLNKLLPSRPMTLFERAEIHLKMDEFRKCVEDAEEALQAEPRYVKGFCLLGAGYLKLKLFGHAEVAVKRGIKIEAENEELKRMLLEIKPDEKIFPPVRVSDGSDQKLRNLQNQTGWNMDIGTFPMILKCIMFGELISVKNLWRPEHLKLRMTRLKNPLIHFPVLARQRITPKVCIKDYCDVIDFLFEQGCRLDHCDKVGYTAIMHACGPAGELELIEHLLKKGADPNVQSSYGTVALHDACQSQHEKIVDLLLQHGADPHIGDNNGKSPFENARPFKKLVAIFDKYQNDDTIEKSCVNCESRSGISRCKSCRYVFYCSKECQVEHWSSHKKQCKLVKNSHMRLKVIAPDQPHFSLISNFSEMIMRNIVNEQYPQPKMKPELKTFQAENFDEFNKAWKRGGNILKLQAVTQPGNEMSNKILTYNKTKDLVFFLSASELDGREVVECIKENGFKGLEGTNGAKGYFLGFVDTPGEIVIITEPMLPAQPW